jgi:hypothetical protein
MVMSLILAAKRVQTESYSLNGMEPSSYNELFGLRPLTETVWHSLKKGRRPCKPAIC